MKTKLPTQSLRRQKAVKPDASKITIDSRLVLRVVFFFFLEPATQTETVPASNNNGISSFRNHWRCHCGVMRAKNLEQKFRSEISDLH